MNKVRPARAGLRRGIRKPSDSRADHRWIGAPLAGEAAGGSARDRPESPARPVLRDPSPLRRAAPRGGCMSVRQRALRSAPLIAFGLAIVFLALSLVGYDPADPPGHGAEPANQPPTNPCGPVGAVLAHVAVHDARLVVLAAAAGTAGRQPAAGPQAARRRTGSARRSGSRWCSWSPPRRSTSWRRRSGPARRSAAAATWVPWSRSSWSITSATSV